MRHNLTHKVVRECWSDRTLDIYQAIQKRDRFSRVKYVLSFLGEDGTSSRFLGCYRVPGQEPLDPERLPENIRNDLGNPEVLVWWNLEKTDLLTEYDRRMVIDWGKGASTGSSILPPISTPLMGLLRACERGSIFAVLIPSYRTGLLWLLWLRFAVHQIQLG